MRRRNLLTGLGCMTLAGALPAAAQQRKQRPVVALLLSVTPGEISGRRPSNLPIRAFLQGLQQRGWLDGSNVEILRFGVSGDRDSVPGIMDQLNSRAVDVVFLGGTSWLHHAAQRHTSSIPLVAMFADDPVVTGFAASLARPGGNMTGVTRHAGAELFGKWLQLLRDAVPGLSRTAFLAPESTLATLPRGGLPPGTTILPVRVEAEQEIDGALAAIIRERADSLMLPAGPLFHTHARRLADFAAERKLPSLSAIREFVAAGGLMSYGPEVLEQFRLAARYVDEILRGANAAALPIEQPTKFELAVNLRTANALGITIPASILVRADEVIE